MEELSMASQYRLAESACEYGLFVADDGQGEAHGGKKNMATDGHSKGSRKGYKRSSENKLDKELAEIKVQLEVMRESIQRNMEDQTYCWII